MLEDSLPAMILHRVRVDYLFPESPFTLEGRPVDVVIVPLILGPFS